jgi:cell division protein FtsB
VARQSTMKVLIAILGVLLLVLQFKLWFGSGSFMEVYQLHQAIDAQQQKNALLRERNAALDAEVQDLKHGVEAIDERARAELGMVNKDETFFQIVDE